MPQGTSRTQRSIRRPAGTGALGLGAAILMGASPAPADSISWPEAVREAVRWHPSVTEAVARVKQAQEEIEVAEAGYRPQLSASLGSGYDNLVDSGWRPRANLSASQMLFDFGKTKASVEIAEAGTRSGRADLLLAVDSLIRDTSYAIIEIQRDRALLEVARDQLASIEDINELVHHRYRLGASTKSDALQAQARVQAADVSRQEIEAEQRRWESNLAYLLGRETAPMLTADPPKLLRGACERGAPDWSLVPAILQARAERDEAFASLERSRADGLPTVSVGANGGTDLFDPTSRRAQYSIGLNVSTPLYSGGARRARVRGAAYALGAADAAVARVRNDVLRQIAEARRQVESLRVVVDTLAARRDSMDETGRLYRLQYLDMGTRTLVDLLNAEQELHQARFDLVNTRFDLRRLETSCIFHAGSGRALFGLTGTTVRGITL